MGPHQQGGPRDEESGARGESNGGKCKTCISITKWLPVLFILTVIGWSYYAFVFQLCFTAIQETWYQIFALIVYHIALLLFLWSYWQACFRVTGKIPKKFKIPSVIMDRIECATTDTEVTQLLEHLVCTQQLPVQTRTNINQIRYCEKCQIIKPDRCHHCSVCGTCVLKMDHHCPWINNCVCFDNYKFFVLFLSYAFFYCLVVFLFSTKYFIEFWKGGGVGAQMEGKFHILFVFFVSVMFAISLVSLLGYHLFLVTRNRSTLESFRAPTFIHGPDKKGFSLGGYNNFIEIFGERSLTWFLPIFTSLGDGITFPTRHQYNTNSANLNGNYNSIDTTDSTPVSSTSPDAAHPSQLVEVKVEARAGGGGGAGDHAGLNGTVINELNNESSSNNSSNGSSSKSKKNDGAKGQETPLVYF